MVSHLEWERAKSGGIEDCLGKPLLNVGAQVDRLRDTYHQASAVMPAIGLNQFEHHVDFSERRLPDLVSFFHFLFEELDHLRPSLVKALDREGICATIFVAACILSTLHY